MQPLEHGLHENTVSPLHFQEKDGPRQRVHWKTLRETELGSVYESLLELRPSIDLDNGTFTLVSEAGNDRKSSGSYYTPAELVDHLITTTIDPGGKEVTILGTVDGNGDPTSILDGGGAFRVLICQSGETSTTIFENLMIQNGLAAGLFRTVAVVGCITTPAARP